jgi:hypothetical protein
MALFVVQHKHSENNCPAQDPEKSGMLLTHLSPQNADNYGVKINAEAVIDGKHTLYLIVEAENEEKVEGFMEPFSMAGSVEIMPASLCEVVIDRGTC